MSGLRHTPKRNSVVSGIVKQIALFRSLEDFREQKKLVMFS